MIKRRIGSISEEVEKDLGLRHQTVSARRAELRHHGYTKHHVENGSELFRTTDSNSPAHVQVATQRGIDAIEHGTPLKLNGDPTVTYHKGNQASAAAFRRSETARIAREILSYMVRYTPRGKK